MVVTCKGRLNHLRITVPNILSQLGANCWLVVVDYGDPDRSFEYCQSIAHPRVMAVRILDGTAVFNLSRARNCGANAIASDILCFVDADSLLHPGFLKESTDPIALGRAALTKRNLRDGCAQACGLCCVSTEAYRQVYGYDEAFAGWGPEDSDFYRRVRRIGAVYDFPAHLYPASLPHSDADRTRFYEIKDRGVSAARGFPLLSRSDRSVNVSGYGRAMVDVYVSEGRILRRCVPISEELRAVSIDPGVRDSI